MRFNCGPDLVERIRRREQWHPWFAWYPVRTGPGACHWLETVERRVLFNGWDFYTEYRPLTF